ncbi:MAG: UDP-2,3-diacylglucosamine diphosphatase [Tannerella sp.]|jgi:UDP-2,3-diacylglucosamine hydrolase|nr:UDP-2,3-diacylglucosamine diphosphatase [Tannerella sp.]
MSSGKIYFASDIHLGNRYLENPAEVEKKLVRWLDDIKKDAAAVYFLGDVFDYWYEYKYVVPRGHVRFLGKLAELSDLGIEIHLFTGNHDIWMFDYLPGEVGAIIHREPITVNLLGKNFFLGHGDEVGYRPLKYRIIQYVFRNRLCQFLYATIHPRWTFVFARGWSLSSRKSVFSTGRLKEIQARNAKALEEFAASYLRTHPEIDFFMFGHLHVLMDKALTPQSRLLITGDWMRHFSYAEWDGESLVLKKTSE